MREAHVYSEIVPRTMPLAEMLARKPAGIILSGGPQSVCMALVDGRRKNGPRIAPGAALSSGQMTELTR